ncbi:putative formin-binding protein 1 [Monocercomonoides exilis]|uniref:putative formin-binding protein 1 n=1 Tax=Monocercomonoides exilis TaxID=2049356 RepID=UPI003559C890|nr:putative formin-binding protein 1 [Monocercomonoides exilis]|eukprot:MONOS_6309.1-p1 / transcript=MONOS_6309.1 / gene=MONOS_6309 / organism=Monocercomonoides_exilis_PA203 / gene_product=unspecified product / transcript_product=unspecified product / location=Mono_scaffold00197:13621-16885(-) / protein_length=935 / sequence_SO=supercontig / SO=protein_coding / is_pseudo=false
MAQQASFPHPYANDPSIDFTTTLWDGIPSVIQRSKDTIKTYEQLIVRFTKNYMAQTKFFEEIKSRKFLVLPEEGTISIAWNGSKEAVAQIERGALDISKNDKSMMDQTKAELLDYEKTVKWIEDQYNFIKKKRQSALDDVTRKREKYVSAFTEWDKSDAAYSKAQADPNTPPPILAKLSKAQNSQLSQKSACEASYVDSVRVCNGIEEEFEKKMTELLAKFEQLEFERLTTMKQRMQDFFSHWDQYLENCRKSVSQAQNIWNHMDVEKDMRAFAGAAATGLKPVPHQAVVFCTRAFGKDVAGSPSGSSSASPSGFAAGANIAAVRSSPSPAIVLPLSAGGNPIRRVLYEFVATNENELTVAANQDVEVLIDDKESGWVQSRDLATGKEGFVPGTYFESPDQALIRLKQEAAAKAKAAQLQTQQIMNQASQQPRLQTQAIPTQSAQPQVEQPQILYRRALYEFTGTDASQLSVAYLEEVEVLLEDAESGWASCRNKQGQEGYVPSNYLETVEQAKAEQARKLAELQQNSNASRPPSITPSQSSAFQQGSPSPSAASASALPSSAAASPNAQVTTAPATAVEEPTVLYRRALYQFDAEDSTQLSVAYLEEVEVLMEDEASGWSSCRNKQGSEGFVPMNYLETKEQALQALQERQQEQKAKTVQAPQKTQTATSSASSLSPPATAVAVISSSPSPSSSAISSPSQPQSSLTVQSTASTPAANTAAAAPSSSAPSEQTPLYRRALYDFEAEEDTHLAVKYLEPVEVLLEDQDSGWASCKNQQGKVGFVPISYLETVEQAREELKKQNETSSAVHSACVNIVSEQTTQPANSLAPSNTTAQAVQQQQQQPEAAQLAAQGQQEQVDSAVDGSDQMISSTDGEEEGQIGKVLYEYTAESESEVSVTANEYVTVSGGRTEDWVFCTRSTGESGYVPANYIQLF